MTFRGGALPIGRPRAGGGRGRRIAAAVLIMLAAAACGTGAALSPEPTATPAPSQAGLALPAAPIPIAPLIQVPRPTATPTPTATPPPPATATPNQTPTPTQAEMDEPSPALADAATSGQTPAPAPAPVVQEPDPDEQEPEDPQAYAKGLAEELLVLINEARAAHGIPPVTQNDALTAAAEKFSEYHFVYGDPYSLDHYLDGRPIERAAREGYHGWIGEVLVTAPLSAPELLELWLNSPGHRAVILDDFFTEVGMGCYHGPYSLASGTILYTTLCAGEFGKPA